MSEPGSLPAVTDKSKIWKGKLGSKRRAEDDGFQGPGKKNNHPMGALSRVSRPTPIIQLNLNNPCLKIIQETYSQAEKDGILGANDNDRSQIDQVPVELERFRGWRLNPADAAERSVELSEQRKASLQHKDKLVLPMNEFAEEVRQLVANNQFCTIVGETGSGKTTQVPQILLDEAVDKGMGSAVNIICTQPRRMAATSVAMRVALERGEDLGHTVGYHIRHEPELPVYGGSLTYCTTGILLKQLQSPDEILDGFSHIILDEVHERTIELDFILVMLKRAFIDRARLGRPVPKVLLMSATIDTDVFKNYFAESRLGSLAAQCPALHVPGRTFPVQHYYLGDIRARLRNTPGHLPLAVNAEKWLKRELLAKPRHMAFTPPTMVSALIAHTVLTIPSGAILVFLPGMQEIRATMALLVSEEPPLGIDFRDVTKFQILQLHSLIEQDQRTVFEEPLPGIRRIFLSTNIAETSVTFPDVTVVIDSGCVRQMGYDSAQRRSKLETIYISQSNLNQRAGRAGRVQPGHYFGLFSEKRIETFSQLPVPEMRLANLTALSLSVRAQRNPASIADFFADAIERPPREAINTAFSDLVALGAIAEDETITSLGRVLAKLPLDPTLGKLVVLAILFRCLDPIIILGVAAEQNPWERGTWETEAAANQARWEFSEGSFSQHVTLLHAYRDLRAAVKNNPDLDTHEWCRSRFIRPFAMDSIELDSRQVAQVLVEAGLSQSTGCHGGHKSSSFRDIFGPADLNTNSHNEALVRAVLGAGLQPNLAWAEFKPAGYVKTYTTPYCTSLSLPASWKNSLPTGFNKFQLKTLQQAMPLMLFDKSVFVATANLTFMETVTPISPLVAALFGEYLRVPAGEAKRTVKHYGRAETLVLGRDNPNLKKNRVPGLLMRVHLLEGGEVSQARDALLQFRKGLDWTLDHVLRKLLRKQSVTDDPGWQLFAGALLGLVQADAWDGTERAMQIVAERSATATATGAADVADESDVDMEPKDESGGDDIGEGESEEAEPKNESGGDDMEEGGGDDMECEEDEE